MAISEDASTPAVATGTSTGNLVTASFSPPGSTLLVALAAGGKGSATTNVTISDSGSHTWTQGAKAQGAVSGQFGVAALYYCYLTAAPGSITVTATYTNLTGGRYLAVRVLNGAAASQTGAGATFASSGTTTTASVAITTTLSGSLVYGLSDATSSGSTTFTVNGSSTQIGTTTHDSTDGVSFAAWRATSATGTPGSTTLGGTWGTAADSNVAAFEVLPAMSGRFLPFFM